MNKLFNYHIKIKLKYIFIYDIFLIFRKIYSYKWINLTKKMKSLKNNKKNYLKMKYYKKIKIKYINKNIKNI